MCKPAPIAFPLGLLCTLWAALLLPVSLLAAQTPTADLPAPGEVIGRIDQLVFQSNQLYLFGWACSVGYPAPINVHVYAGGGAPGGTFVIAHEADWSSEPEVSERCETSGVDHRFLVPITYDQVVSHAGRDLYVHGISPDGAPHPLLLQSGVFQVPDRVRLSYVTAHDPSWDLTLPSSLTVVLDTNLERGLLTVEGRLECPHDGHFALRVQGIDVNGPHAALQCGQESAPFDGTLDVVLTDNRPFHSTSKQPGKEFLVRNGGTLRLIGRPTKSGWVKLSGSAETGSDVIRVDPPAHGWEVGDTIVVGPTGFDPSEAEERTIEGVSLDARELTLDTALDHFHWGHTETFTTPGGSRWELDERAEVMNLSRRIRVMSDDDVYSRHFQIGAHMMIMPGSAAFLDSVEFFRVGQMGQIRRYPFHWHLVRNGHGQYIKNSSVHRSFNRCVTVHGTDYTVVQGNSCYDHYGHGFFLEDGSERRNTLTGNIGMWARKVPPGRELLQSDNQDLKVDRFPGPSNFWISNPDNDVSHNVAAGSEGSGFWMAFSTEEICSSPEIGCAVPTETDTDRFDHNIAHSSKVGITHDGGPNGDDLPNPRNGADREIITTHYSPPTPPVFRHLQAYKNSVTGIYFRGDRATYTHGVLADNSASLFFAFDQEVKSSLVVGMSGNMSAADLDVLDARQFSLEHDLIGVLVYDGPFLLEDVHFANFSEVELNHNGTWFAPTVLKLMGGQARYVNQTQGLTFDPEQPFNKLDLRRLDEPRSRYWSDSYTASIHDIDGTLSGHADVEIRPDHPLNHDASCFPDPVGRGAMACAYQTAHLRFRTRTGDDREPILLPFSLRRDTPISSGIPYPYAGFPNSDKNPPGGYNKFSMILDKGYTYHVTELQMTPGLDILDLLFSSTVEDQLSPILSFRLPQEDETCAIYEGYASPHNQNALPDLGSLAALETTDSPGFFLDGATVYFRLAATSDSGTDQLTLYGLRCQEPTI